MTLSLALHSLALLRACTGMPNGSASREGTRLTHGAHTQSFWRPRKPARDVGTYGATYTAEASMAQSIWGCHLELGARTKASTLRLQAWQADARPRTKNVKRGSHDDTTPQIAMPPVRAVPTSRPAFSMMGTFMTTALPDSAAGGKALPMPSICCMPGMPVVGMPMLGIAAIFGMPRRRRGCGNLWRSTRDAVERHGPAPRLKLKQKHRCKPSVKDLSEAGDMQAIIKRSKELTTQVYGRGTSEQDERARINKSEGLFRAAQAVLASVRH